MDGILLQLWKSSEYVEPLRAALISSIATRVAASSEDSGAANSPRFMSDEQLVRVLRAGVQILVSAESDSMARAGLTVVKQFGSLNQSLLCQQAVDVIVQPVMTSSADRLVSLELLRWLLPVMVASSLKGGTSGQSGSSLLKSVRHLLPDFVTTASGRYRAHWLSELAKLLVDEWPDALPKFECASRLAETMVSTVASLTTPTRSADIAQFTDQLCHVQRLFVQLFISHQTVMRAMDALYVIISLPNSSVCPGLSVVLQAVSQEFIRPACVELVNLHSNGDVGIFHGIVHLCDWLLLCPRATSLTLWLGALIKQLATRRHTTLLCQLVNARIEKLFGALILPAVRHTVFPVVSLMLLGFQHSPEPFHKVIPLVPSLVNQLRREGGFESHELRQLSDLMHTLISVHSVSHQDTYRPLLAALQGVPRPDRSKMRLFLDSASWTSAGGSLGSGYSTLSPAIALSHPSVYSPSYPIISPPLQFSSRHQDYRGLENLGNTCYMNAVLQALFATRSFRTAVLRARPAPQHRLLSGLQRVFAFLQFSDRLVYSPTAFLRLGLPPWFENGRQQDCSEFLRYMLNALHEEQRTTAEVEPYSGSDSKSSRVVFNSAVKAVPLVSVSVARRRRALDDCDLARDDVIGPSTRRRQRRHSSCDAPAASVSTISTVEPESAAVAGDVVMVTAWSTEEDLRAICVREETAGTETADTSATSAATSPDRSVDVSATLPVVCRNPGSTDSGIQCDDDGDALMDASCEESSSSSSGSASRQRQQQQDSLVRRLLGGSMETTYSCLSCRTVSRHVDTFTDLNLAFPDDRLSSDCAAPATDGDHGDVTISLHLPATSERRHPVQSARGDVGVESPREHREETAGSGTTPTVCDPSQHADAPTADQIFSDFQSVSRGPEIDSVHTDTGALTAAAEPNNNHHTPQVSDLLRYYMRCERLSGDNQYWCEPCGALRDADRQLAVLTAPGHLLVSLVRFLYDRRSASRRKLLTTVRLEQRLRVPLSDARCAIYKLQAVIVHAGVSLDAGHYYCCARMRDAGQSEGGAPAEDGGVWYQLNDSHVSGVQLSHVVDLSERLPRDSAYVLVYCRESQTQLADDETPLLSELPEQLRRDILADNGAYSQRPAAVGVHQHPPHPPSGPSAPPSSPQHHMDIIG